MPTHGIRFADSQFWVIHRRREFGPFDYEWSQDFCGVEFHYRGEKFGEFCSVAEISADLKPFRLPMRVVEVTSVVLGSVVAGILEGLPGPEKQQLVIENLRMNDMHSFAAEIEWPTTQ